MAEHPIRCAVYTRKSTEEGLDQAFNSLDAQREACAAYIASQRHEGWTMVPDHYDDGGISGGTMERPGLKQLLADVASAQVQVIVVYKVDRLTRSLADFARIVDILDTAGASFVSVTQAFNTTSSMGRLTLNVLLSFAQFEREVTGERIRDKIAASKRKGMWMGGPVPLGYEVKDRKLVVNNTEAETVRAIMRRYLAALSVRALIDDLATAKVRTKRQQRTSGPHRGGILFARGSLTHLLKNRIYRGEIVHRGIAYPGEHPAIVDAALWDAVQAKLASQTGQRASRTNARHRSVLAGRLSDGLGRAMTPSHTNKGAKRYRYYITHADAVGDQPAWRVPAQDLEQVVVERLRGFLTNDAAVHGAVGQGASAQVLDAALSTARSLAGRLNRSVERYETVRTLIRQVDLHDDHVIIQLSLEALSPNAEPIDLTASIRKLRRGHEVRLVIAVDEAPPPPPVENKALQRLLAEALGARELLIASSGKSIEQIAVETGQCRKRLGQLIRLGFMSPDLVQALLAHERPAQLIRRLMQIRLPLLWSEQRALPELF